MASPGKRRTSVRKVPGERTENVPTHIVGDMGSPNSVSIKLGRRTYRALVDTGAEVSVMSDRVYRSLRPIPELQKRKVNLQAANGSPLHIDGLARLQIKIGNQVTPHDFFVIKNLNRNFILGVTG